MRFDEFVAESGVAVFPVDRFDGFAVDVGMPADWEPFDSSTGIGVWVCRTDPCANVFCANAVLTLHRVEACLDTEEVFTMVSEQQLQSLPGCRELRRELSAITDAPGVTGVLAMQITHELGTIDSVSRSRVITTQQETLIAQLTVTALRDSPVERADIWLSVRTDGSTRPTPSRHYGGVPAGRTRRAAVEDA